MEGIWQYVFLQLLRSIVFLADKITDFIAGWSLLYGDSEERARSEKFEHPAHVMRVLARARYGPFVTHTDSNFLCLHKKYMDPSKIWAKENIFMFGVTETHVLFSVIDHDVDGKSKGSKQQQIKHFHPI